MNGKIGVFDSGVGGLSVLREIHRLFPHIPTVYCADQKHVPYGPRPHTEIYGFVRQITDFLIEQGAEVIVLACHAGSAAALYPLREAYPHIPFVGIEPAVKPAVNATKTGVIGVLTTQATADGLLYRKVLNQFARDAHVITQIAPRLVTLVESGEFSTEAGTGVIREYITPLLEQGADQLVLACTHFPFLADEITRITGDAVTLVDPGLSVAKQVGRVLPENFTPARTPHTYFTTGDINTFQQALKLLIGVDTPAHLLTISDSHLIG
ncbi:MAG: glutamate racemase [Phototrophicales bacterium]|nr:glutamate racemase [Phototrophicales bacterium]